VWGGFKKQVYTILMGGIGVGAAIFMMGFLPGGALLGLMPLMLLLGFMIPMVDGPIGALFQSKVDNAYQGRVMTLFGTIVNLSGPIGLVMAGPLSDRFGLQIWFITAGCLIFISFTYGLLNKPFMSIDDGPQKIKPQ